MNQLTLEWSEAGEIKTQTISDGQDVKIGRDPAQCEVILKTLSVSRLHVEIFFKPELNRFCLRNLQTKNPPIINDISLIEGEVALTQGSTIYLGEVKLTVVAISQEATLPSTILPNYSVDVTETSPSSPQRSKTKSVPTPPPAPPSQNGADALECHNCGLILPLEARNTNCTRCGHFLDVASSIIKS